MERSWLKYNPGILIQHSTCPESGECDEDIKKWLAMGRSAMQSLSNMRKTRDSYTPTKVRGIDPGMNLLRKG